MGQTFTMRSEILGEVRRVNVYAPAAYDALPKEPFPVLYMPDGGIGEDFLHVAGLVQISSLNGTMRPFLLVGIENTERGRDLTGPTSVDRDREVAPRVGGSTNFRAFIRDELMPRIDAEYRTSGETAIVGESLAGLFVVETLLTEPDLFDTYLAIDPSLWWDDERLVDSAVSRLEGDVDLDATVFLAASSQTGIVAPTVRLATVLREGVPGLRVRYAQFPEETHLTIYHPAALEGFRDVFAPLQEAGSVPGDTRFAGPAFFAVQVRDIEAASTWYRDILELQVVNRLDATDGRYAIRVLSGDGLVVELIEERQAQRPPPRHHGHFKAGIYVSDLEAFHERLLASGVDVDAEPFVDSVLGVRSFVFRDLDGNRIQAFTPCDDSC